MSEAPPISERYESQHQRWVKYGVNVLLAIIVVIALGVMVTWLAQRFDKRIDTTTAGLYSLKPQTVNLIKSNTQKIRLISLYTAKDAKQNPSAFAGAVSDLLEEYARKGKNIEFEAIDPITQPAKTDDLVGEAVKKYGGAVKAYQDFIDDFFKTTFVKLKELTSAEAAALANEKTDAFGNDDRGQSLAALVNTVREQQGQTLTHIKDRADRALRAKFPDYKAIVDRIKDAPQESLDRLSQNEDAIIKLAGQYQNDDQVPAELKKYLVESIPRHQAIKQLADDTVKKIGGLGELKVGELQQAIKDQNIILVLGENEWRVINFDQVWVTDSRDLQAYAQGKQLKPKFAGEQAITTAILAITQKAKTKIAFVRSGGSPLTSPGFPPFQRGGPLSDIADRLRGYNFEIVEKDITGMWPMQAQMQQIPAGPEASEKDLENAIWVVVDTPPDQRMPNPTTTLAPKLAEHLSRGGAAMVLVLPEADNLAPALKDFGVEIHPDAVIVHEVPKTEIPRSSSDDPANDAQRLPFVFVVNQYGDAPLVQPVNALDGILVGAIPVQTHATAGVQATPLIPIPSFAPIWGEHDIESLGSNGNLSFDPKTDLPPPLWAGAAIEKSNDKKGASRLIVLGVMQSFMNQILSIPDPDSLRRGVFVNRFPGNSELFVDSIFWLAKMDSMIAISPAAMDTPRIAKMSDASLTAWRVAVLGGLPALVLAAGIGMYLARRG